MVKVHLRCLSWPVRGLLFILLFISAQRAAALTQRIELYRDNALLDTNPLRRLDNVMVVARNFSEKYTPGGVVGNLGVDSLKVGDFMVNNASIGSVTQASVNLTGASCDGIFGLARPGLARSGRPAFYKMLSEKGLLDEPTFSIWLNENPAGKPAGSIEFGGSDPSMHTGSLYPLPVISTKYWMVPLSGLRVGGTAVPLTARGAILHSGSALSLLTAKDFLYLGASIPGITLGKESGALEIVGGCSNISSFPNITFGLGTGNFSLTPQQYIVQIGPKGACALCFQNGAPDDTIVLGTNFLRAFYSTYTYNSTSRSSYISLAPSAQRTPASKRRSTQEIGGYPGDPVTETLPAQASAAVAAAGPAASPAASSDILAAAVAALQPPVTAPTAFPASTPAVTIPVLGGDVPITPGDPAAAATTTAAALAPAPVPARAPATAVVATSPAPLPGVRLPALPPVAAIPTAAAAKPSAAPPALKPAALAYTAPPPTSAASSPRPGGAGGPAVAPVASARLPAPSKAAVPVAPAPAGTSKKAAAAPVAAAGSRPAPTQAPAALPRPAAPRPQPSAIAPAAGQQRIFSAPAPAPSASSRLAAGSPLRTAAPAPASVAVAEAAAPKPAPRATTPASAPAKAPTPKAAAAAGAPAPRPTSPQRASEPVAAPAQAVAAFSVASAPAPIPSAIKSAAAPEVVMAAPAKAPAKAPALGPAAAPAGMGAPKPQPLPPRPAKSPSTGAANFSNLAASPAFAPSKAPAAAPALAPKSAPPAVAGIPAPSAKAVAPSPATEAAIGAPVPAPAAAIAAAPQPSADLVYATSGPLPAPAPAPGMSMQTMDLAPPFQAVAGIEALYGGLTSLWQLPLQISDTNDTLFAMYLASRPLTAKQNASLAKPRPPTTAGFSQAVSLVALDEDLDTCVVGWSSVNSCRAKGLNETICSLMPVFSDVATVKWQCPDKNETKVELPVNSGSYVPISQQWLLVRAGPNATITRGGQQIYNAGLGKCLDVCTDASVYSQCGHPGNIYLEDCDATSRTQQWLLTPTAMANATLATVNKSNLTAYQISSYYVDPAANVTVAANGTETAVTRTCLDTCEAERSADALSSMYQETTCNLLLPTYPSSAAAFPCSSVALPRSILQGFAIVTSQRPAAS